MQGEVQHLSGNVIHDLFDRSVRSRGEALARELSDALANPLYYNDLEQVGALVRNTSRQQVVRYVLVFDEDGRLIHDGSVDVLEFGQPMRDPLATGAVQARELVVQQSPKVLDNAMPIMIGNQRIGGVRVGMALDDVQAMEKKANQTLGERLQQVGKRHLGWLLLMLGLLVGIGVVVIIYVQRTLVTPIRWLAGAARQIEAGDYNLQMRQSHRQDEVGELVRAFGRMSQAIARHDREVRHMAYTDALTGLTNRLAFREALDHRLRQRAFGCRPHAQQQATAFGYYFNQLVNNF
jgi:HAMP domain-containing protein